MKSMARLFVAFVTVAAASPSLAATGQLAWNGLCTPGVLVMLDVSCSTGTPCQLFQKLGGGSATELAVLTSGETPIIADIPHGVTSEWWIEANGVAVTDTLSIDGAKLCTDN